MNFIEAYQEMKKGKILKTYSDWYKDGKEVRLPVWFKIEDYHIWTRCKELYDGNWYQSCFSLDNLDATDWEIVE